MMVVFRSRRSRTYRRVGPPNARKRPSGVSDNDATSRLAIVPAGANRFNRGLSSHTVPNIDNRLTGAGRETAKKRKIPAVLTQGRRCEPIGVGIEERAVRGDVVAGQRPASTIEGDNSRVARRER